MDGSDIDKFAGLGATTVESHAHKSRQEFAIAFAKKRPFVSFVSAAAAMLGVYFFLIASPVYVASTELSIRGKEAAGQSSFLNVFVPSSGGGIAESIAVQSFIHSPQMVSKLDERHDLRSQYASFRIDPLSRINRNSTPEAFLRFYRKHVITSLDREAAILKVSVRAYRPEDALAQAQSILEFSEDYINAISARIREETINDARAELDTAAGEVRRVRLALADFRNRSGELDPASRGAASVSALIALEADITRLRGELASQLTINRADAPQVRAIEAQINSLERQASDQRRTLASENTDGTLAEVLRGYEGLVIEREYAETRLTAALAALDAARQLADQRERFVVTIVEPVLPGEASEPRRLASFLLGMILAVIGYAVSRYTIAGIKDHEGHT